MKKTLIIIFLSLLAGIPCATAKKKDLPSTPDFGRILSMYQDWNTVEFSGKLKYGDLPLTPTVKMYMQRDSLIQISVRAPFVGEVGRLQITPSEITAVNKLKKTYCIETMEKVKEYYPAAIADFQSLFLGRVVLFGNGELSENNYNLFYTEPTETGGWVFMPDDDNDLEIAGYGWLLYPSGRAQALMVSIPVKDILIQLDFDYQNRGEQLTFTYTQASSDRVKTITGLLEFNSVKWGGKPMSTVNMANYKKLSIKSFISSFRL